MTLKRFIKIYTWAALWIVAFVCYVSFAQGQGPIQIRPKIHIALTNPGGNGAIQVEMWCDQITVGHDDNATYCWHDGVAVIKVPHSANFSWVPLEAK